MGPNICSYTAFIPLFAFAIIVGSKKRPRPASSVFIFPPSSIEPYIDIASSQNSFNVSGPSGVAIGPIFVSSFMGSPNFNDSKARFEKAFINSEWISF